MAGKKSFIFIIAFVFLFRNKEVLMARKADIRNSILIPAEICDPCNSHKSLSAFLYAGRLGHCRQDARRKRYNFQFFSYKNNKIRLIRNITPNQPCFLFLPTPLVQQLPCAVPRLYVPVTAVADELLDFNYRQDFFFQLLLPLIIYILPTKHIRQFGRIFMYI